MPRKKDQVYINDLERALAIARDALSDLDDVQDHEEWCGHGKAGCVMCKVIEKCLNALQQIDALSKGGK